MATSKKKNDSSVTKEKKVKKAENIKEEKKDVIEKVEETISPKIEEEIVAETVGITKVYKKIPVLNDVNIKIRKGDIYGLVGKNGAGKTTLIRILSSLVKPTNGYYTLFGKKNEESGYLLKNSVGAMIEKPGIYHNLNAYQNIKLRCIYLGKEDVDIPSVLKSVGLESEIHSKKKVKNFSLGMKQRLGLAILTIAEPKLLLLDEPTNGLDPEGIIEIRNLLLDLNKKGCTILISSHILGELSKFATRYGFLDKGRIVKEISAEDLEAHSLKTLIVSFKNTEDLIKARKEVIKLVPESDVCINDLNLIVTKIINTNNIIKKIYDAKIEIQNISTKEDALEEMFMEMTNNE